MLLVAVARLLAAQRLFGLVQFRLGVAIGLLARLPARLRLGLRASDLGERRLVVVGVLWLALWLVGRL